MDELNNHKPGKLWVSKQTGEGQWLKVTIIDRPRPDFWLVRIDEGSLQGCDVTVAMSNVRQVTE